MIYDVQLIKKQTLFIYYRYAVQINKFCDVTKQSIYITLNYVHHAVTFIYFILQLYIFFYVVNYTVCPRKNVTLTK